MAGGVSFAKSAFSELPTLVSSEAKVPEVLHIGRRCRPQYITACHSP